MRSFGEPILSFLAIVASNQVMVARGALVLQHLRVPLLQLVFLPTSSLSVVLLLIASDLVDIFLVPNANLHSTQ